MIDALTFVSIDRQSWNLTVSNTIIADGQGAIFIDLNHSEPGGARPCAPDAWSIYLKTAVNVPGG